MSFDGIHVNVLDPSAAFAGLASITEAISVDGNIIKDGVAGGSVVIPINATNVSFITRNRAIYAFTTSSVHGNPMEIVTFLIKRIEPSVTLGQMTITVSGPNLLHELTGRNINDNIIATVTATTLSADANAREVETTLDGAVTGGTASIVVTDATGFAIGQPISVELDAGGRHNSTITNVTGTTITFADNLPSDAADDLIVTTETGYRITVTSATGFAIGQPMYLTLDSGEIHVATILDVAGTTIRFGTGLPIDENELVVATSGNAVSTHAIALDDIEQIMAFAPSTWNPPLNNTPNGSYIVGAGESVLEALDLARQQGGGHYRLKVAATPVREVVWLDAPDAGNVTALVMPDDPLHADFSDATKGIITELRKGESDQFEQVTRIFVRGAGGLRFTAAEGYVTEIPGIDVDYEQSLLTHTLNESGGAVRNERYVTFGGISPAGDSEAEELQAAINLYNAAFAWLNRRQTAPTFYDVTCIVHQQLTPFSTIQLTYTGPGLTIDEALTIQEISYHMSVGGPLYAHVKLGDVDEWQEVDDATYTATAIRDINQELRHITGVRGSTGLSVVTPPSITAGDGIVIVGSLVSVDLAAPSGLSFLAGDLQIDDTVAGAGLTITGKVLSVGAGAGLTVGADTVALTTPGTITSTSTNSSTGNHTHAIDGTILTARTVNAGNGLSGGGALTADITLHVGQGLGLTVNADTIDLTMPGTLSSTSVNSNVTNHTHSIDATIAQSNVVLTAGAGLTGGGDLTTSRTFNVGAGLGLTVNADSVDLTLPGTLSSTSSNNNSGNHTHVINTTIARSNIVLTAGAGLVGGGDLTASRTFDVGVGDGLTVNANSIDLTLPGTLSVSSTNTASGSHTHAITSSSSISTSVAVLMATDANGRHRLKGLGIGAVPAAADAITVATNGWIGLGTAAGRIIFDDQTNDILRIAGADIHMYNGAADVLKIRRSGDVASVEADIYADQQLGLAAFNNVGVFLDAGNTLSNAYFSVHKNGESYAAATEVMRVVETGFMGLNETGNTGMTIGLTINQGANDDEILALKSSDVAHGMTSLCQTDTYGSVSKINGLAGGLDVWGLSEDVAALRIRGISTNDDTGKSTTAIAPIIARANKKSGTTALTIGANGNLFVVANGNDTRFIVDAEGDIHYDGTASAYDEHDDIGLIRLATRETAVSGLIDSEFDKHINANREQLEEAGIVTFNDNGRHFINMNRMQRLQSGALWQIHERLTRLEEQINNGL